MPTPNRKIFDLVESRTDGNVRKFAELIGVKQQSFNRIFNPDPRSGKFPSVSGEIICAIRDKFGFSEAWFYQEEKAATATTESDDSELRAELERLRNIKLPTEKDKIADIWLRFMEIETKRYEIEKQRGELMREMVEFYKQVKGE